MENKINVEELLRAFVFEGELENVIQLHDGHINNTYVFDFREENGKLKELAEKYGFENVVQLVEVID